MKPIATIALLPILAGCAGGPTAAPEPDPAIEEAFRERRLANAELAARQSEFNRVLLNLDKMIDSYVYVVNERIDGSLEGRLDRIVEYLTRQVDGHFEPRTQQWVAGHYEDLVRTAGDATVPANQSIALAALGFSSRSETLSVLVNGVESDDFNVSNSAVLGLAILKDERTRPALLIRCVEQDDRPLSMRANAAWALYQIQTAIVDTTGIVEFWKKVLERPIEDTDPGILISAVRGMGYTRNPGLSGYVTKYVSAPTPQVRMAAAIALGRMGDQGTHESLLALLGPAEPNPNVRLAARKALQALAGGVDRGYSVVQWRKVFEREP